jgi:hypothetical protein
VPPRQSRGDSRYARRADALLVRAPQEDLLAASQSASGPRSAGSGSAPIARPGTGVALNAPRDSVAVEFVVGPGAEDLEASSVTPRPQAEGPLYARSIERAWKPPRFARGDILRALASLGVTFSAPSLRSG